MRRALRGAVIALLLVGFLAGVLWVGLDLMLKGES